MNCLEMIVRATRFGKVRIDPFDALRVMFIWSHARSMTWRQFREDPSTNCAIPRWKTLASEIDGCSHSGFPSPSSGTTSRASSVFQDHVHVSCGDRYSLTRSSYIHEATFVYTPSTCFSGAGRQVGSPHGPGRHRVQRRGLFGGHASV